MPDATNGRPANADGPYALGFTTLDREVEDVVLPTEGALPAWLTGRLIRTATAKFEVGQQSSVRWFDGLAMLHDFGFGQRRVRYSCRFVQSRTYRGAMDKDRIARPEVTTDPCRTLFGRVMPLVNATSTDDASVTVAVLGDDVVALAETPTPIQFDPVTLVTRGRPAPHPVWGLRRALPRRATA